MTTNTQQTQADLIKAITDIATTLPMAQVMQLYQFALFLKMHPLPEEMFSEILADEALWESQFASTDDSKKEELGQCSMSMANFWNINEVANNDIVLTKPEPVSKNIYI